MGAKSARLTRYGGRCANKKPADCSAGSLKNFGCGKALTGLGQRVCQLDRVRMISFHAVELVAALEHAVEFIDEQGDRFVAFVGLDDGIHFGALDDHVSFRLEARRHGLFRVTLKFDANAHDALLVSEQSLGFLADERLEGRSQFEVNARDDEFVVVHDTAYGLV
jgi:hypothetical protein